MSDEPNDSMILRLGKAGQAKMVRRGKDLAGSLRHSMQRRFDGLLATSLERLARELRDPENVMRLQENLARVAQWSIQLGFRLDPSAKDLFDFVVWIEERHGQEKVMAVVMKENLLSDGALLEFLLSYTAVLSPGAVPPGESPYSAGDVEVLKQKAAHRLLKLLTGLAALETETAPPLEDPNQMVDYFEDARLPTRFAGLAARAVGRFDNEDAAPDPSPPPSIGRIRRGLGELKELVDESKKDAPTSLARFVPGLHDRTLQFVVFSYTFFLQTYLLRALIENLPELIAVAQEVDQDEDPSEVFEF